MEKLSSHEILVGTYEEFVLGFFPDASSGKKLSLKASFADHAHCGPVRSLAAGGKFLLSGGSSDENAKIYNLRNRREHGSLYHHDGSINAMTFFGDKYLFTAAEDNKICVVKTGSWSVEKTLLKHQGAVNDISIHPSGKLALSVGQDRKLITWNLVKGRSAFVTNIKEVAHLVRWSPNGSRYAVGFYKRVDIYDVATAAVIATVKVTGRTNAVEFLNEDNVAVAADMPNVIFYDISEKKEIEGFKAHERRIRCLSSVRIDDTLYFMTASNDGFIKIWQSDDGPLEELEFEEIAQHNTKCRITSMVVYNVPEVKEEESTTPPQKKRKTDK